MTEDGVQCQDSQIFDSDSKVFPILFTWEGQGEAILVLGRRWAHMWLCRLGGGGRLVGCGLLQINTVLR